MPVVYTVEDAQGVTHLFRDEARARALNDLIAPHRSPHWRDEPKPVEWCHCPPDGLCDAGKVWGT